MAVKPNQSFHLIDADESGFVNKLTPMADSNIWMNAGFFVFSSEIFDHIHEGEELVVEPFERLTENQKLRVYKHEGFWGCMDTYKEKQYLDGLYQQGKAPWTVWENASEQQSPTTELQMGQEIAPAKVKPRAKSRARQTSDIPTPR